MIRKLTVALFLGTLLSATAAHARNYQIRGDNELCGGFGFSGDISYWTPGGFKWFNDYSRKLSRRAWFNAQLNVVFGGGGGGCWRDSRDHWHCDRHWGGYAVELAAGVKLKWRLRRVPLQFHAKFGGALDIIVFDDYWHRDWRHTTYSGVALGFRGGFGVRYFFVPTFGVGAEIIPTFGPAFINNGVGAELYAAVDFNAGVEWLF